MNFIGKTAVITGAGRGLGRCYALELAKRGCNVVVNDIHEENCQKTVKDIADMGGKAAAVKFSLQESDEIMQFALQKYNSVDILINNAGHLMDKSFAKMSHEEWSSVLDVHLNGTFRMCHSAWPIFQSNKYGRIVNISSGAGLYGHFGQANYASAKMGIIGLTNTLAIEGGKHNIRANTVVPIALSAMTANLLPESIKEDLNPDLITPLVTYLCHDSCDTTGALFEAGGGWYSQVRWQRSQGRYIANKDGTPTTAETLRAAMPEICAFDEHVSYPVTPSDALQHMHKMKTRTQDGAHLADIHTQHRNAPPPPPDAPAVATGNGNQSETKKFFEKIQKFLVHDATNVGNEVQKWIVDFKNDARDVRLKNDNDGKADVTIICPEDVLLSLVRNDTSPEMAFMRGSLKVGGNVAVAMKLKPLLSVLKDL